jgi:hypothetical protein
MCRRRPIVHTGYEKLDVLLIYAALWAEVEAGMGPE